MKTTDKNSVRQLASLLVSYGVSTVVMSPGSRNAPLLVAFERQPEIETHMVIDERSAGFIALGMADAKSEPIALVCTSGTAPLNYAPAVAEAYYRKIPLIVITADRPYEWIDQDDSQTIIQPGIYANYIKGTFDIPVDSDDPDRKWYVNRALNDALTLATQGNQGPVHINVRIAEPVGRVVDVDNLPVRNISTRVTYNYPQYEFTVFSHDIVDSKGVLIIIGFLSSKDAGLVFDLNKLARLPNVVVLHEAQANLHGCGEGYIPNIDATLSCLPADVPEPDIVITIGGALTSRMIKEKVRSMQNVKHWSICQSDHSVDCFRHLDWHFNAAPFYVLNSLVETIDTIDKDMTPTEFKQVWLQASEDAKIKSKKFAENAPWSDFKAMNYIMTHLPESYNLQLSNGTAVRYAQLFEYSHLARIFCNRGVSGIDGCTSTAIGFSLFNEKPTVLISGDMSFQYDIGALATTFIPRNFKIVVLSNGGGGIFRFIAATRHLDEVEKCFAGPVNLPLKALAEAYGMNYYCADNEEVLPDTFALWLNENDAPSILEIKTDGQISAEIITNFFKTK